MDDEDFGEFGIAPKQVKAKDKFFSTTESFAGFRDHLSSASTIDDVLKDVVSLNATSIGVRILKRMKKNAVQKLTKDCSKDGSTEGYLAADRIFPLEFDESDLKSFFLNPKKNLNGLGYKGLRSNVNFSSDARLEQSAKSEYSTVMKGGKKLTISGEAFGYGALDEDDGYEAEVYTFDDLSKYDYSLTGGAKQQNKPGRLFNSILSDSHLMDDFSKAADDFAGKLNDGQHKITVPADWTPRPPANRQKGKRKSRWDDSEKAAEQEENRKNQKKRGLDANQRAEILGEDQGSLEREQIEAKLAQIKEEHEKLTKQQEKSIGEQAFRSLEEQVTIKPADEPKFKKPLTGFFASKFVQSDNTPLDVLKPGLTRVESLPQTQSKQPTNQETETETKSFVGKSNREIYQWHPHKLLCKRFNVPHPYPQFPDVVGVLAFNKTKQSAALEAFLAPTASTSVHQTKQQPIKREVVPEVIEEFKRPDMNLFKAVFDLSDDDEDDLSDIEEIEEVKEKPATTTTTTESSGQACDEQSKLSSKSSSKPSSKPTDEPVDSRASSDPPKIVFNKSFVKRSTESSKEEEKEQKSKPKRPALNLFESELDLSDEEGVNLLEIKRKKSVRSELDEPTKRDDCHESKQSEHKQSEHKKSEHKQPVQQAKSTHLETAGEEPLKCESKVSDPKQFRVVAELLNEPTSKDPAPSEKSAPLEKSAPSGKQNSEPVILSDSDDLDGLVDEIMKPVGSHSSSHKKKRKKHKEHKKHKKKHKRSSRDSD